MWFTETGTPNAIGKITTSGVVTEYSIPTPSSSPGGIAAGPDGNMWFTEINSNKIGKITMSGIITEYDIPTAATFAQEITAGPDGNMWFAEYVGKKIGKVTPTGTFTEYDAAPSGVGSIIGIAANPDGSIWFTDYTGNQVGRMTPSGVFSLYPTPTPSSTPFGIAAGPDNNVWFVESGSGKVGVVRGIVTPPTGSETVTTTVSSGSPAAPATGYKAASGAVLAVIFAASIVSMSAGLLLQRRHRQ
jgi:virginiamycin B lyase